jgi:WD40 repeat protein
LRGHETPVLHLAALADGKTLVSCGSRTVRYWNVGQLRSRSRQDFGQDQTDEDTESNTRHAETRASSATAQPSDIHLRSVNIPDVPEGNTIRLFTHARDGSLFVYGTSHPTYAGRATIVVAIDRHTGKVLRTFNMDYQNDRERHNRDILAMDVSPDGRHLAVATGANTLDIWDVETGNRIHSRKGEGRSSSAVAYSPDGKWLVVGNDQGTSLFNARTHELERTVDAPVGRIDNFVFSDNGARLASYHNRVYQRYYGDFLYHGELRLWDVGSGKLQRSMLTLDRCRGVSLSPDGSNLASRSDRRIDLWNTATGDPLEIAGAHMGQVNDVVLSPDGESAATATDYSVHLWDASTGTLRKTIWLAGSQPADEWPYVGPIVFTPGGDLVISQQKKQIGLFSSDGQFRRSLYALNGGLVKSMAILPEQNRLAFGMLNLAPENLLGSPQYVVVLDLQTGETVQQFPCKRVGCFLPCGDTLFSRSLEAWDLSTGRRRRYDRPADRSYKVAASPDSRVLVTLAGKVRLWDLVSGQVIRDFKVPTRTFRLAVAPGGRVIATGSDDATVRLWDAASGAELAVLEGHGSRIESLAFSSAGRRLATASQDHTALVWDLVPHLQKLKPPAPPPDDPMLLRSWHALAYQLPPRPAPLKPAPLATLEQQAVIDRSMGQLGDDDNATALQAAARLEAMSYLAVPALRSALRDAKSPDIRKRIESILAEIESPEFVPPDRHTTARAIRVLESLVTDHARSVLETLAAGAPDAPQTKQAQAALERIATSPTF